MMTDARCTSHTGERFNLLDNYSVIYLEELHEHGPLGGPARLSGTRSVDPLV